MVLLESGENLKEKQTADIRKKFGETIDLLFDQSNLVETFTIEILKNCTLSEHLYSPLSETTVGIAM